MATTYECTVRILKEWGAPTPLLMRSLFQAKTPQGVACFTDIFWLDVAGVTAQVWNNGALITHRKGVGNCFAFEPFLLSGYPQHPALHRVPEGLHYWYCLGRTTQSGSSDWSKRLAWILESRTQVGWIFNPSSS